MAIYCVQTLILTEPWKNQKSAQIHERTSRLSKYCSSKSILFDPVVYGNHADRRTVMLGEYVIFFGISTKVGMTCLISMCIRKQ